MNEDEWGVFGSDDDDDNDCNDDEYNNKKENTNEINEISRSADIVALSLTKKWLSQSSSSSMSSMYFGTMEEETKSTEYTFLQSLTNRLLLRGVNVTKVQGGINNKQKFQTKSSNIHSNDINSYDDHIQSEKMLRVFDVATMIVKDDERNSSHLSMIRRSIVPGGNGILIFMSENSFIKSYERMTISYGFHPSIWDVTNVSLLHTMSIPIESMKQNLMIISIPKRRCLMNQSSCEWKEKRHDWIEYEYEILQTTSIPLSVQERLSKTLDKSSIEKASSALMKYGFCIIRDLYDTKDIQPWANAACHDLQQAIQTLKQKYDTHLLYPHLNQQSILSYKELAMREDLRVDLRDGPKINEIRSKLKSNPLQEHPSILQIVTHVFHPTRVSSTIDETPLYRGNFGLWNFNGLGPDASPPPPKAHPIGFVISMPGCACQAIHADTPHLFENVDTIPPHYMNLFISGRSMDDSTNENEFDEDGEFTGNSLIGGTAFICESHKLSKCAMLTTTNNDHSIDESNLDHLGVTTNKEQREDMYKRIIRPSLTGGDALLFDCRILHFGLANRSNCDVTDINGWRPLLYSNLTTSWFTDPKNWDDRQSLFSE